MDNDVVDVCPICKSTPITTPNLRFKIAPLCYHRICEGCVDRKFQSGKTDCPVAGCSRQYWKRDWKTQTFADLQVEREVDIRKRVFSTLDKDESEFQNKRYYDDFLELREELVMNLVLNMDVAGTNKKLNDYRTANGLNPKAKDAGLKPKGTRQSDSKTLDASGLIKGLKIVELPAPRSPYDPFMGMPKARGYYELRGDYETRYDKFKQDKQFDAAGYDFQQYMDESLLRAFAGLGVFIEDEMARKGSLAIPERPASKVGDNDD